MNIIKQRFGKFKPRYLVSFEEIIKTYAQFGGGALEEKFNRAKSFSNVYEMYIYAYFLGIRKNKKVDIQNEDSAKGFWEIENWKPADVVDIMLSTAVAESEFDLVESELVSDEEVRELLSVVLKTIEAYANGGLLLIKQELESDEDRASDDLFFVKLLAL